MGDNLVSQVKSSLDQFAATASRVETGCSMEIAEIPKPQLAFYDLIDNTKQNQGATVHPYAAELDRLRLSSDGNPVTDETFYLPLEGSPYILVQTQDQLQSMIDEISAETVVSVSLE
jgi:hypothetical protein